MLSKSLGGDRVPPHAPPVLTPADFNNSAVGEEKVDESSTTISASNSSLLLTCALPVSAEYCMGFRDILEEIYKHSDNCRGE